MGGGWTHVLTTDDAAAAISALNELKGEKVKIEWNEAQMINNDAGDVVAIVSENPASGDAAETVGRIQLQAGQWHTSQRPDLQRRIYRSRENGLRIYLRSRDNGEEGVAFQLIVPFPVTILKWEEESQKPQKKRPKSAAKTGKWGGRRRKSRRTRNRRGGRDDVRADNVRKQQVRIFDPEKDKKEGWVPAAPKEEVWRQKKQQQHLKKNLKPSVLDRFINWGAAMVGKGRTRNTRRRKMRRRRKKRRRRRTRKNFYNTRRQNGGNQFGRQKAMAPPLPPPASPR